MMLFPPREATTTAEPPEPFTFQHSEFIIYKQNIQEFVGPAGRHFGLFSVFCGLFIRVHSCPFVVQNQRARMLETHCLTNWQLVVK